jgi:hypothetical protein
MNPDSKQKWRIIFVITIILISLSIFAWIAFQWEQGTKRSERHDYMYEIDLSFDKTIENVTLLLPVPVVNNTPVLIGSLVNGTGYGVPADWDLVIVEENGTPMLSIRADRMVPEYHGFPIPIEPGKTPDQTPLPSATEYSRETPVMMPVHIVATASVPLTIDTRNPLGHEPVFVPEGRFTPLKDLPFGYRGTEYVHMVPIFISYTSDIPATLTLRTSIQGVNSIWKGGWVYNRYSDTVSLELGNGTQGWVEVEGTFLTGDGVYY